MQNDKALKQAKANVDKYFTVVGVLENLNETLAVLETRIPRYFNGLQDMYFNELLSKENRIVYLSLSLSYIICHCIKRAIKIKSISDASVESESAAWTIFVSSYFYLSVCLFVAEPHFNKNKNNPRKLKESVRKKLERSLQMEYDFYYFVKKKLMSQYHSIKWKFTFVDDVKNSSKKGIPVI